MSPFVPASGRGEGRPYAASPWFLVLHLASGLVAPAALGLLALAPGRPHLPVVAALGWLGLLAVLSGSVSWAALRKSDARYRLLADHTGDMVTRHERDGRVSFAAGAVRDVAATDAAALTGDGLAGRLHRDDADAYRRALDVAWNSALPTRLEIRLRRDAEGAAAADPWHWVEMTCRPVPARRGADAGPAAVVTVTRHICERKRQEAALSHARSEAAQADQLRSRFLASVSHELRTPLHSVIGFSEVLAQRLRQSGPGTAEGEYVGLIHENGQQLLKIVNDLLDLWRIEAGKYRMAPERFDLVEVAQQCGRMLQDAARERKVRLLVASGPAGGAAPVEVVADRRACKQILINLIANAIKFSREGGEVRIEVADAGDEVVATVTDRGTGIPADLLARLGAPFVQADDRGRGGPGLGLPVVKGLLALHGGRLDIDSVEGAGTRATARLPKHPARAGGAQPGEPDEENGAAAEAAEAADAARARTT